MQANDAMENIDLVGRRFFGEYTITKKLGEGGMGAVYLARQNSIDQMVALKVLHARAAESDEIVQRFHREAKVISMLTHPNIVRVFIFGRTQDDLLYLVMEYVEGMELRERLAQQGTLDELVAIKIIKQMCSALAEAHDLGIIHRDLKPDNVLLANFRGDKNFVKILDFGIAKLKQPEDGEPQKKLTQAGIVYGTPEYLSPEQAQALELDHRTDIYSLGCMLYELITGRVPFDADSPVQILTKHVFEDPAPPSKVAPGKVAPTMERIILKAMSKEQDDRFNNALEMFDALGAREQEIVRERKLDSRATYFPGSELTGIHSVDDIESFLGEQDAPRSGSGTITLDPPAVNRSQAQQQQQQQHPTGQQQGHPQQHGGQMQQHQSGPMQQNQSGQMQQHQMQPPQGAGSDPSRKIIIAAIVALVIVLLGLVGFILVLLMQG
jgi:serine/threonine-protein kinase